MTNRNDDHIAGWKRASDWHAIRGTLGGANSHIWRTVFEEYFRQRLELRYLHPIKVLQDNGTLQGEGFAILAIQCSLIEFLESTAQGTNYRYLARGEVLGPYEYSSSQSVFVSFLTHRQPFANFFDEQSALDFYRNVRCGLLHEARTNGSWRVWAEDPNGRVVNLPDKIVYRDTFQRALVDYIDAYGIALESSAEFQTCIH